MLTVSFLCYSCSTLLCTVACLLRSVVSLWLSRSPIFTVSFTALARMYSLSLMLTRAMLELRRRAVDDRSMQIAPTWLRDMTTLRARCGRAVDRNLAKCDVRGHTDPDRPMYQTVALKSGKWVKQGWTTFIVYHEEVRKEAGHGVAHRECRKR
jgi:hypothetical protein